MFLKKAVDVSLVKHSLGDGPTWSSSHHRLTPLPDPLIHSRCSHVDLPPEKTMHQPLAAARLTAKKGNVTTGVTRGNYDITTRSHNRATLSAATAPGEGDEANLVIHWGMLAPFSPLLG
jgi:hypothetical protein